MSLEPWFHARVYAALGRAFVAMCAVIPVLFLMMRGIRRHYDRIAAELVPVAVMFYRALPSRALRVRDLFKFGAAMARADVLRIALAALCLGLLALATPLITKLLIDSVLPRAEADQLLICAIALVVVTLVAGGFQIMQGIAILRLESRLHGVAHFFQAWPEIAQKSFISFVVSADRLFRKIDIDPSGQSERHD